jgi:hypothetical protein
MVRASPALALQALVPFVLLVALAVVPAASASCHESSPIDCPKRYLKVSSDGATIEVSELHVAIGVEEETDAGLAAAITFDGSLKGRIHFNIFDPANNQSKQETVRGTIYMDSKAAGLHWAQGTSIDFEFERGKDTSKTYSIPFEVRSASAGRHNLTMAFGVVEPSEEWVGASIPYVVPSSNVDTPNLPWAWILIAIAVAAELYFVVVRRK